jgi:hypothetical protein
LTGREKLWVFVTNRNDAALEIWRDYNGRAGVECRIDELENNITPPMVCPSTTIRFVVASWSPGSSDLTLAPEN